MEALSIVSVAASLVQFIQFGSGILDTTQKLHESAKHAPEMLRDAEKAAQTARWRIKELAPPTAMPLTQEESLVEGIRVGCIETADLLVSLFHQIRCKDGVPKRRAQLVAAIKAAIKEKQIMRLRTRLDHHLQQLQQLDHAAIKLKLGTQEERIDEVHSIVQQTYTSLGEIKEQRAADSRRSAIIEATMTRLMRSLDQQFDTAALIAHGDITSRSQRRSILGEARKLSIKFLQQIAGEAFWATQRFVSEHAGMLKRDYKLLPDEACTWIAQTEQFQTWFNLDHNIDNRPGDYVLALTGGRGSGKFLGTSYITKYVLEHKPRALVLNFCKLSWERRPLTPHLLLKCLISELIDKRPEVLANVALSAIERNRMWKRFLAAGRLPDYNELFGILSELVICDQVQDVIIVIDGLDTCSQRPRILADLIKLCGKAKLRLAISDQNDADVRSLYEDVKNLELKPGDINCDIAAYVTKQLQEHLPHRQSQHSKIHSEILTGAAGQLGWARHILSCLCNAKDDDEFDEALATAAHGKDMAVGGAFDRFRSDPVLARPREQFLIKAVCRGLVRHGGFTPVNKILAHCIHETSRDSVVRAKGFVNKQVSPRRRFRYDVKEVEWVLDKLCGTKPILVRKDDRGLYSYENDAVTQFFMHYLPPTMPQIPPLWLATDNCYMLACHLDSIGDQNWEETYQQCAKHVDLKCADWHSEVNREVEDANVTRSWLFLLSGPVLVCVVVLSVTAVASRAYGALLFRHLQLSLGLETTNPTFQNKINSP